VKEVGKAVDKFKSHQARIGIIGLGYAGLPLALTFAEGGLVMSDPLLELGSGVIVS